MTGMPFRIGLIGCGNISDTYLNNARLFPQTMRFVACADLSPEAARLKAEAFGLRAMTPDALCADPDIEIVLNLTTPAAHAAVSGQALLGGKHVYSEKPLATTLDEARQLADIAASSGLHIACAPDTILGAAHQAARAAIDSGLLGSVVSAHAAVMDRGMETWHPNPDFFFKPGGGPVMDMGPYYLASLIGLLGPVEKVASHGSRGIPSRTVGIGPSTGQPIDIEVDTTVHSLISFASGCNAIFSASWDVWDHFLPHLELCGTEGTIRLPDPNWFGGGPTIALRGAKPTALQTSGFAFGAPNRPLSDGASVADYRIVGLVDLCHALIEGRPPRLSLDFATHVLAVMEAIVGSKGKAWSPGNTAAGQDMRPPALTRDEADRWR